MNALDYTSDLVAFGSISSRSNADVSDYVEKVLKRLEFETERIEYTDAAGVKKVNVVGKKGSGRGAWRTSGTPTSFRPTPGSAPSTGPFHRR